MPRGTIEQGEFIRANFRSIWPAHLAGFTRLLVQLRNRFDGDLDLLLVLAVIGERTRPDSWKPEVTDFRQLTNGNGEDHLQYPINIQSVSEFSGIPRETVRRKVAVLQKKGWVTRDTDGRLAISSTAAEDLEDVTHCSTAYLEVLFNVFDTWQDPETQKT